ncbi:hypothetical protein [Psychroserpens ponticola]|uniref:Uncharacterized protein n=1 Tax=Psychroserpens ponticola TaxID=2932268 RepID=A0ABY7S2A2_9FLAO|nr:hypothetical protein [Psychroserpens ponticola]WCO03534.1 hypothetical protein MUN68_008500 [Psychroserpens ponticola]
MKSYLNFKREITELQYFHISTIYAFDETENLLHFWRRHRLKFDEETSLNHIVSQPTNFGTKKSRKIKRRKNLNEIIFVRLISALEVFLVDLVRDAFLETKEPFKKQDLMFQLSQAEILSIKSTANFFNKVINKECRKLSSSGFSEIIKYYKKHFYIEMGSFSPGRSKMEEYHERRHLLVHRLGRTDSQYRKKYNTNKLSISISDEYLNECIDDLSSFCNMVHNQMKYQLKNEFTVKSQKTKSTDRTLTLNVEFENDMNGMSYFQPDYEFWSQDEFSVFSDILDSRTAIDANTIEFIISGSFAQIRSYTRIINRSQKKEKFVVKIIQEKNKSQEKQFASRILDDEILSEIEKKLPEQPWITGIHKIIARELEVSNKLVSTGIQQLIAKGVFKQQINGILVIDEEE